MAYTTEPCDRTGLDQLLKRVRDLLQDEEHEHCVSVTVQFTSQGYTVTRELRSPGSLNRVSMRNLKGCFIE